MAIQKYSVDEVAEMAAECDECNGSVYCFTHKILHMRATPAPVHSNGTRSMRGKPAEPRNSWERGRVTEDRPGGFKMPVISPTSGSHMGVHEWSSQRSAFEKMRNS